jgi:RNase H-like domain found in reverse transcriptase
VCGVEAHVSKVDHVLDWPRPRSCKDVRSFLGLVCYISVFLPNLAEHTRILTPLTTKQSLAHFPSWTDAHQCAFDAIKNLVISRECLTVIDHDNPGDNHIYVTCDASDWQMGTTLSFGPTWELAHPVAFDSMQLKSPERNYPVHEK